VLWVCRAFDDLNLLATIISREMAAGNFDGLALALASAARSISGTDVSLAATLITQAVTIADSTSDDTQSNVGSAASFVATAASNAGDTVSVGSVETAINGALDADMQSSYNNAGGQSNPNVTTGTGGSTTTTGDVNTPTGAITPPGGPPPPPPNQGVVALPVPVEPNPSQAGSPV